MRRLLLLAVLPSCWRQTSPESIDRGVQDAYARRPRISVTRPSPELEKTYCPPPLSQLGWEQMLDCAEYQDANGDRKLATNLWVKVAAVAETSDQRCLALHRLETRTDGRPLGLVPQSTFAECRFEHDAQAKACSERCTADIQKCQERRPAASLSMVLSAVTGVGWTDAPSPAYETWMKEQPDATRCGEEFTACYRSCTIVR